MIALHFLRYQEVFPERTSILPETQRIEICCQGISNAGIIKVNLSTLAYLSSEIPAVRHKPEDDKGLFKQVNVAADCFFIDLQQS